MPPKIDQFVPLVATMPSAESREFQITIIPQGEQAQSFPNGGLATGGQTLPGKHGGPVLSVQRDNGQITHIKIQCNCGQVIDVECLYKEAGKGGQTAKVAEAPKTAEPPKPAASPKAAEPPKAKAPPKAEKAAEKSKEPKAAKGRK
jgi:hypothetical protein